MSVERANPYGTFNFLVDLGTGDTGSVKAGFQEVSGLNTEVTSTDYRNGNEVSTMCVKSMASIKWVISRSNGD